MIVCEEDLQCGGFTFKGSKDAQLKYDMYFFHYINEKEMMKNSVRFSHWSTYVVESRSFVILKAHISSDVHPEVIVYPG